jgi:hypothetical protein
MSLSGGHVFSRKKSNKSYLKLYMKTVVLLINGMILRTLRFDGLMTDFGGTGISRCFNALRSVQTSMQHSHTLSLVSFNRYTFHLVPCEIRKWFIHLGFERQDNLLELLTPGNRKVCKKVKLFSNPANLPSQASGAANHPERLFKTRLLISINYEVHFPTFDLTGK